jgi:uncharacterized Zn finger protein
MSYYQFPPYVTVAEKRARAEKKIRQLKKKNPNLSPVIIEGRTLAHTWWGKSWNTNLERYADYSNRIGRGRSYVRHLAVLDLNIGRGKVDALVQGSRSKPYAVEIKIEALPKSNWKAVTTACTEQLDSLQDLLAGRFPKRLAHLFMEKGSGLFPSPKEIQFSCSCPDWAYMCKHVAAVLYGIGARLDQDPSLFFHLRQVNMDELITKALAETTEQWIEKAEETTTPTIAEADLGAVFGIDMDALPAFDNAPAGGAKPVDKKKTKQAPRQTKQQSRKKAKANPADEKVQILDLLKATKNGITAGELQEKSGIDIVKIRNILFLALRKGEIQKISRGVYQALRPSPTTSAERQAAVLSVIESSPKGIRAPAVAEATGLLLATVRPVINRLMADGKIRRISRGVYGPLVRRHHEKQATMTDVILKMITTHPKGVGVADLMKQSGCEEKQVRNIVSRLFWKGKIRRVGRGIYAAVERK